MPSHEHHYAARLTWDGNLGDGTASYVGYGRQHRVSIAGKPDLELSADPVFRGDGARANPEDLFLAALSSCHLLSYLALCARKGVRVLAYEDDARGTMLTQPDGSGRFTEVVLRPRVTIADADKTALALQLHDTAHHECYIANSCSVPVRHEPVIVTA
jgi:organic hydroperoxide reductase OsmC/OhrA